MDLQIVIIFAFLQILYVSVSGQFNGNVPGNGFVSVPDIPPIDPLDPWASLGYNFPSASVGPLAPHFPQNPQPGYPYDPANRGSPGNGQPVQPGPPHNPWGPIQPVGGGRGAGPGTPNGGAGPGNNNPSGGSGTVVTSPQNPYRPPVNRPPVNRPPVNQPPVRPPPKRPTPRPRPTVRAPNGGGGGANRPVVPVTPRIRNPGRGNGPVVVEPVGPRTPENPPVRRPGTPNHRGNGPPNPRHPRPGVTGPPRPSMTCAQNPCQNRGTCFDDPINGYRCACRHLYVGDQCEIIISPPQHISIDSVSTTRASISWKVPPSVDEEISGYVVQYNKFGYDKIYYSPFIHPSVADFTLTDLEPNAQYTVCVSIILVNMSHRDAVLRDQCVEVRTRDLSLTETGLPVTMVAIILGGVVAALILVMLLALCCQRKCLHTRRIVVGAAATVRRARTQQTCEIHGNPKTPVLGRTAGNNPNNPKLKEHEYSKPGPPVKERALPKVVQSLPNKRVPPTGRTPAFPKTVKPTQHARTPDVTAHVINKRCNHSNNANSKTGHHRESIIIDIPPTVPEHDIAMEAIKTAAGAQTKDPAMQASYYARSYSITSSMYSEQTPLTENARQISTFNGTPNRTANHPASRVIRALPQSVCNHMMRSKNARDKDATNDFDMARTYFMPRA